MPSYGLKLMSEIWGPADLVRQATVAEEAGFDFLGISDHFHPWLEDQGHSPSAWTVLGAIAQSTARVELVTMVTCPFQRYHPAIVAQLAATTAVLSGGRFILGVGTGELLNEHVVGGRWESVDVRREQLAEAVEAIRLLWGGGYRSYRGRHVEVVDARIFDRPDEPPPIIVAAGGPQAAELAARIGDGVVSVAPEAGLLERYRSSGGTGHCHYGELALAWDPHERAAVDRAHRWSRFGSLGGHVLPELPNPTAFEEASSKVTMESVAEGTPCGPDAARHVKAVREFIDAGFDNVAVAPLVDDLDGFVRFWTEQVRPQLP